MLSPPAKATLRRIEELRFTEADVRTVFIEMRDKLGPVIREIGDLIAHPQRDRGSTLDFIIRGHAQMEIYTKYGIDGKMPFSVDGSCDWWLKCYLIEQTKMFDHKSMKKALKVSPKSVRREIRKYFPNTDFPVQLSRPVDQSFIDFIKFLSTRLVVKAVIDFETIQQETGSLLTAIGLGDQVELIDDFIVCMCILFHQVKFELPSGNTGHCELFVEQRPPETFERDGQTYAIPTEHGMFRVLAASEVSYKSETITISFPLFETNIKTDQYIDKQLVIKGENGFPYFDLRQSLQFDKTADHPVKPA